MFEFLALNRSIELNYARESYIEMDFPLINIYYYFFLLVLHKALDFANNCEPGKCNAIFVYYRDIWVIAL